MDWAGFRFQDPLWLWAALVGPLVVGLVVWRERSSSVAVNLPALGRLGGRVGWRARVRHLPLILVASALVAGAVALARPQHGNLRESVSTKGVDIVVALDVSGSMAAEDFQPRNRLTVAKEVVAEFVKRRTTDRVGLVIFAAQPLTKVPPTTDTAVLLRQLDDVSLGLLPDGTAIGSGLATALNRLRKSQARSRVVVLVTDGSNNAGEMDPVTAADIAKALEVRVYTVLVGRGGQVPVPVQVRDSRTGQVRTIRTMAEVQIDEKLLERIASRTGAEFFRATDPESLRQIFGRIDALEKTEIRHAAFRRYQDLFPPVVHGAMGCMALAGLLWLVGLRVVPV
jgi:Ca-activated chloride channel family protein